MSNLQLVVDVRLLQELYQDKWYRESAEREAQYWVNFVKQQLIAGYLKFPDQSQAVHLAHALEHALRKPMRSTYPEHHVISHVKDWEPRE